MLMPRAARIFRWGSTMSGGNVWVAPLMVMVAERSGRSCLTGAAVKEAAASWSRSSPARARRRVRLRVESNADGSPNL